ncbi:MAG: ribonuclease HII [Candidatus Bathyarchaeota archaeon]
MGPLIIAGVLIERDKLEVLRKIGVKDSKLLEPERRETLAHQIKKIALKYTAIEIKPPEIDKVVLKGKKLFKLNYLEAETMAKVIEKLKPEIAYVDASDIIAERFGEQIRNFIEYPVKIISEHKADSKYLVVGAASILAKTLRDSAIDSLSKIFGEMGNGYPTDTTTQEFLREWIRKHGEYPDFVRKSWKTAQRIRTEVMGSQSKLF